MTKRKPPMTPSIVEPMVTAIYRGPSGALQDGDVRLVRNGPPGEMSARRLAELDADPTVLLDVVGEDGVARSRETRRRLARRAAASSPPTTQRPPAVVAGQEEHADG